MNTIDKLATTQMPQILQMPELHQRYASKAWRPSDCIAFVLDRIAQVDRPEVWISTVDRATLQQKAAALDALLQEEGSSIIERLPLFGLPFAVKDNIDVAGMPTTAACPGFAYLAERSATVVDKLEAAGAILIGKTNLDQFATGLNGTRSPYGAVRNAVAPDYVSGGSSSGSAVAVALGLVSFSLGTDTAGSGRVPAGLNGIVGLKPTRGLFSTRGLVPACRTLDCISVFARSVPDAWAVTGVMAGFDAEDGYSRALPMLGVKRRGYRIAMPRQLEFFGDAQAEQAFAATIAALRAAPGVTLDAIDFTPFTRAADLLYKGPWVAERLAAIEAFRAEQPEALHPVVGDIIGQGAGYSAVDAFNGQYQLAALRREAETQLAGYDFLLVPTTPTMPTIDAMLREPVKLNSQLGHYTNFVNFFDMAALAVPAAPRADGLPAGVTLIGPAGADQLLAAAAETLLPMPGQPGATAGRIAFEPLPFQEPTVLLAVVGAHLEGQPLNWQLLERGARKRLATRTAPRYRLYALAGTVPPKPGLVRSDDGTAIDIEVWELPVRRFGEFVMEVPAPLAIGSVELDDGSWTKGFVCEPQAIAGARDISAFGGWRAFLASSQPAPAGGRS
jgi:allophanate hydrolase